jgi:protocatechuate 3,4-dioxygenase beta subunit
MKCLLLALIVSLLFVTPSAAQPAPRPATDSGPPGVIRGRVTAADTGKPLRRARISLRAASTSARAVSMAATNAQGVFELKDVPPGSYYVSASRTGYLELEHGQRRPRQRGLVIVVNSKQTVERVDIALPRGGVIAGRISDELGEPYPGVSVSVWEVRYLNGRPVPFPAGTATTDDLGQYRIPGLLPGPYQVSARSSENWRNEKDETLGYAATFYPGVMADAAQTITLGTSQQRVDLDFAIAATRTARIRGRVVSATGVPLPGEPISLGASIRGSGFVMTAGMKPARTESDGSFEIRDVSPGDYALSTRAGGGYASLHLSIVADVDNVLLVPRTGSTVTGTIVGDDNLAPPFEASGVRLSLIAPGVDDVLPTVRAPAVNNDWSFALTSMGGPFLFRVQGLPADWMLDAVKLNDVDITDKPWDVPTGGQKITGLRLVLTRKIGTIAGSVADADGKPTANATVVIFADDRAVWTSGSRFVRSVRPNSDGAFTVAGLPAATYLAVARDSIVDGQWENADFLESIKNDAIRVTLTEGGRESVALKLPVPR